MVGLRVEGLTKIGKPARRRRHFVRMGGIDPVADRGKRRPFRPRKAEPNGFRRLPLVVRTAGR